MRRFTYSDASSHKFWNIEVEGDSHTVTYGKIGTNGQTKTKSFASAAEAQKDADKLIAQKMKKGYQELTESEATTEAEDSTRRKLEEAILADPSDLGAQSAYADYLTEQGDPQGEFIQTELALNDETLKPAERKRLQKRSAELLEQHYSQWVGDWAELVPDAEPYDESGQKALEEPIPARFMNGIFVEVAVGSMFFGCARKFVAAKETRLVRNLRICQFPWSYEEADEGHEIPEEWESDFPAVKVLLRWEGLKNLRVFQYGWEAVEEYDDYCSFRCHQALEEAHDFVKQMPLLEELYLFAHRVSGKKIFALDLPHLRVLQLYHSWEYPLTTLAKNASMKNLTHLLLHPHALDDENAYIRINDLRAILKSDHLNKLTHLRLRLTDFGDKGVEEIISSGILQRLKLLDLRHGCISDDGAKMLAECDDLTNLEHLDLKGNFLTQAGIDQLKKTGVSLEASHQNQGDPTSQDYPEWLYQGDYE